MSKVTSRRSAGVSEAPEVLCVRNEPPSAGAPETRIQTGQLARWIEQVRQTPSVREELVQQIKVEIAAGTYETPEKLDIAIERMLDDLAGRR
jgi:anti-sigma28 factor (negative regulator of flagellin synthesis)